MRLICSLPELTVRSFTKDTVDKNIYVPFADFCFGFGGKVIYVRNSSEIVAVNLD